MAIPPHFQKCPSGLPSVVLYVHSVPPTARGLEKQHSLKAVVLIPDIIYYDITTIQTDVINSIALYYIVVLNCDISDVAIS